MNDLINNLKKVADYHTNLTEVEFALDVNNQYISSAMEKLQHTLANMKADINIMNDGTVTKIKDTFEKHPVEAGEVEEVCEGEGDTEKGGGKVGSHLIGQCPCLVVQIVHIMCTV